MKRKRGTRRDERAEKRAKPECDDNGQPVWPLLRCYYPKVVTLRQYLASKLCSSKKRQKRLLHYGRSGSSQPTDASTQDVAELLDGIVVGTADNVDLAISFEAHDKDLTLFTQQLSESTAVISPTQGALKQNEIVDFAVWLIFRRHQIAWPGPSHILARGFQKYRKVEKEVADPVIVPGVPGIWRTCTNPHVEALKSHPWTALPPLLGKWSDNIISNMLLHTGLFQPVTNSSNLVQLSGVPLSDLKTLKLEQAKGPVHVSRVATKQLASKAVGDDHRGLSEIRFVQPRRLYAKSVANSKGDVRFGLSHVHVLNRYAGLDDEKQTIHVMKYMFPRQFGLHNVFTSKTNPKETAMAFKDYTLREQEISRSKHLWRQRKVNANDQASKCEPPLPKRLRGQIVDLIRHLRIRHSKCAYKLLLEHYCPIQSRPVQSGSMGQATATSQVSAFCRAVILNVYPSSLWGTGETGVRNRERICQTVDNFLRLGRYETLSLHDVMQKIQIKGIEWLAPVSSNAESPLSKMDFLKRQELMAELVYYLFDSFLVPLIRGHFYVTESSISRNRLFYFRQDVWRAISDPALQSLKHAMLEPCRTSKMKRTVAKRKLGVSRVRLLPKEHGMRPIINLRRRAQQLQYGRLDLGKSINTILSPAFSILNYEKEKDASQLGASLFSVEEMFPRLQSFRATLEKNGLLGKRLFFAKVDVKACFDTIPQKRLLQLTRTIVGEEVYCTGKYARAKLVGRHDQGSPPFGAYPRWSWETKATAGSKGFKFAREVASDAAEGRSHTVYVDGVLQNAEGRQAILDLLEEHIECNMITLGKRVYRQKRGLPQGSKISSLLCSYFYAELERQVLHFVNEEGHSMLLRLIDDFLLISTEHSVAERFVRTMHAGIPEFGVEIKTKKSQINFDLEIDGAAVTKLPPGETRFPYCGNAIDTVTLDLSKDWAREKSGNMRDAVAVEHSSVPGQNFYRKTLNALKLHMKPMLLSTSYNSTSTVLANLQYCFGEVAQKTYHYMRALEAAKQPRGELVIRAVDDLIELAHTLATQRKRQKAKNRKGDTMAYACSVNRAQMRWLACAAFTHVFRRRQSRHQALLTWLDAQMSAMDVRGEGTASLRIVGRRGR